MLWIIQDIIRSQLRIEFRPRASITTLLFTVPSFFTFVERTRKVSASLQITEYIDRHYTCLFLTHILLLIDFFRLELRIIYCTNN